MRRFLVILILFSIFFCRAGERRVEIWNRNQVRIMPFENITFDVAEKIQYNAISGSVDVKYGELSVGHQFLSWFRYGVYFRYLQFKTTDDKNATESRPTLFVTLSQPIGRVNLALTNRMEYRTFSSVESSFRHRQSLKATLPQLASWGMQFYFTEETYQPLNSGSGMSVARFYSGLTVVKAPRLNVNLYYAMGKHKLPESWTTRDVMGIDLAFKI